MQTKTEHLNRILEKIAFEEAKYLEAAINAGCHIISLAEPVGTADMVGEKYFRECIEGLCAASVKLSRYSSPVTRYSSSFAICKASIEFDNLPQRCTTLFCRNQESRWVEFFAEEE